MNPLPRLRPTSFRSRIVLSTVALVGVVMVCVAIGLDLVLSWSAQRDVDRVLEDRAEAVVSVVKASSGPGGLSVPDGSLDPGVLVYDGDGQVVAGVIAPTARELADQLATASTVQDATVGEQLRLRALPFRAGGELGVVVVSQDTRPYEASENEALAALAGVGLVVLVLAVVIARRVTTQALAPVAQMAARAADWSEHDLSHRFDLGPADAELAQLGDTLDRLLDRVAMAIRSEQRLTSELAHELRTPLTAIQGSADLALLRGVADAETRSDLVEISRAARVMAEVITTLVEVARDPGATGASATCRVADLVAAVRPSVPERLDLVDETDASTAPIAGTRSLVLRALAPIVDNAVKHAGSRVTLRASDLPHEVTIEVTDDGPGVDARIRNRIFDVGASGSGGTGLGLGIAQRVARSLGGEIVVGSPESGAAFVLRLPRA